MVDKRTVLKHFSFAAAVKLVSHVHYVSHWMAAAKMCAQTDCDSDLKHVVRCSSRQ
jgi:hypothetical protein